MTLRRWCGSFQGLEGKRVDKKPLNGYGEWALGLKEGREIQPHDLFAMFMAMPHAGLAHTASSAVARIEELKKIASLHEREIESLEKVKSLNEEIISLLPKYLAEQQGRETAKARWARLDEAKKWAFDERDANPKGSRTAFLTADRLKTIKTLAKDAGEPLTGNAETVKATVTSWFRKAAIK